MSGSLNTEQLEMENLAGHEISVLENPNLHPLLIPEIVRELVKFIKTRRLPKCRFVCKLWNEEIVHEMKERSTFSFESSPSVPDPIKDFLENGQVFFGFKNLELSCTYKILPESSAFKLLSSHGKYLRRLQLGLTYKPGFEWHKLKDTICLSSFQELEHLDFLNLPGIFSVPIPTENSNKLHKLTRLDVFVGGFGVTGYSPPRQQTQKFFKELLQITPNLREFHLASKGNFDDSDTKCAQALLTANPPNLRRLYFHLHHGISKALLKTLSNKLRMKIEKLFFGNIEGFKVDFDSSVSGNKITIEARDKNSDVSGVPVSILIDYIHAKLNECEKGVSCTQLLKTFLHAFDERIQAGAVDAVLF